MCYTSGNINYFKVGCSGVLQVVTLIILKWELCGKRCVPQVKTLIVLNLESVVCSTSGNINYFEVGCRGVLQVVTLIILKWELCWKKCVPQVETLIVLK